MDTEIHAQIIDILDRTPEMTIATVRPDGFPQATVVSFVHDDIRLYFATLAGTQKSLNIAECDKVSCTITPPYADWDSIEGLSLGGHAHAVTDAQEFEQAVTLLMARYPQTANYEGTVEGDMVMFRIDPVAISILDYTKGFGHAEFFDVQEKLPPAA